MFSNKFGWCLSDSRKSCFEIPTVICWNSTGFKGNFWRLPTHSHQYSYITAQWVALYSPLHHLNYQKQKQKLLVRRRYVGQWPGKLSIAKAVSRSAFTSTKSAQYRSLAQRKCVFCTCQTSSAKSKNIINLKNSRDAFSEVSSWRLVFFLPKSGWHENQLSQRKYISIWFCALSISWVVDDQVKLYFNLPSLTTLMYLSSYQDHDERVKRSSRHFFSLSHLWKTKVFRFGL